MLFIIELLLLLIFIIVYCCVFKAGCWDCNDVYVGKTKRDRKTEHFKALTKRGHLSAVADHINTTGHYIKCDHFEILASGKTDLHYRIKETIHSRTTTFIKCQRSQ